MDGKKRRPKNKKVSQGRSDGALAPLDPADLGSRGGGRGRGKPGPGDKGIGFCWKVWKVGQSKPPWPQGLVGFWRLSWDENALKNALDFF